VGTSAVGYELKIMVQIEVGNDGKSPPVHVVAKVNAKLGEVSEALRVE
jgi:hypothetical protein